MKTFELAPNNLNQFNHRDLCADDRNECKKHFECTCIDHKGSPIPVDISLAQLTREDEDMILLIIRDISRRKAAEKRILEERNKVTLYNKILSHDINNLNHGLLSYLQMILENNNIPASVYDKLATCSYITEEISSLIMNIRKMRELDYEGQNIKWINFTDIFKKTIKKLEKSHFKASFTFYHDLNKACYVKGNELLSVVVYNILSNAIKHANRDNVKIVISHHILEESNQVKIEFKDNGPGIPDELKKIIFDSLDKDKMERKVHNFGIGLTLVKQIISNFEGKIWVEDRIYGDPSKGTNFVVLLQKVPYSNEFEYKINNQNQHRIKEVIGDETNSINSR
jgi:signal transduction histidine kinase